MRSRHHAVMFLATGFYVGRVPFAPGTLGSLVAFPVVFLLACLRWPMATAAVLLLIAAAVWIAGRAERQLGSRDPGAVVIDEIAGMCVTLLAIPLSFATGVAGFLLFRLFDIVKPPPIRQLDRRLQGGWGIVMDDVAAGIAANIVLRIGIWIWS
ncbi:phosphatidylglycerophosphatase A family protein [Desulfatitalea alkaliphila]|uniref:Phosphatidylglycerophosphatase A n=1 Tax=Desulfatitalea alkaliphila TaxID=2929485 RepID=A0AA41UM43_9BACT|nr:phosphatidylglycerophosphatase A [Desulfatitalea alkaliphila]MCJ8503052.1 phosphatidylglycerophosphatase A [Desulfatitalea alkaliphila]